MQQPNCQQRPGHLQLAASNRAPNFRRLGGPTRPPPRPPTQILIGFSVANKGVVLVPRALPLRRYRRVRLNSGAPAFQAGGKRHVPSLAPTGR